MRFKVSDVREVEKLVHELDAVYQEAVDLANRIARELGLAPPGRGGATTKVGT